MPKILLIFFLLCACAGAPPDVPLCAEVTPSRGFCTNIISDVDFLIDDEHPHDFGDGKPVTWWDLKPMVIYMPPQSWVALKAWIIKTCKQSGQCGKIGEWQTKLDALEFYNAKP